MLACLVGLSTADSLSCHKDNYTLQDDGKWYKVVSEGTTHCAASVNCNRDGARVAMIKNQKEIEIVTKLASEISVTITNNLY